MGAWGFDALDSDQALDWLGQITDEVGREIEKVLGRFNITAMNDSVEAACDSWGMELRAAAYVVVTLNFFSDRLFPDLHERCADALEKVRDSAWVSEWTEPEAVRTSIQAQIDALREGQQPTTLLNNFDSPDSG